MIIRPSVLCAGLMVLVFSTLAPAHQVNDATHKHVTRPTAYGKIDRQGHTVNGSNGNITIWSPSTLNQYGAGNSVRFARPTPYTRQSGKQPSNRVQSLSSSPSSSASQSNIPQIKSLAPSRYGKDYKRDYGK